MQVAGEKLVHLGTCVGKLTHSGKFHLMVGCLDLLAAHAKYKVASLNPKALSPKPHQYGRTDRISESQIRQFQRAILSLIRAVGLSTGNCSSQLSVLPDDEANLEV